jgi:penicillin amidase/acyl-homoserine-lactone acylase
LRRRIRLEAHLPGDTSKTLWTEYLPFDQLPQIRNPASGILQNCNNTPYQTTSGPENPEPADYSPTLGIRTRMTNRAVRALELFTADESVTEEEFYAYKFDMAYSRQPRARVSARGRVVQVASASCRTPS